MTVKTIRFLRDGVAPVHAQEYLTDAQGERTGNEVKPLYDLQGWGPGV